MIQDLWQLETWRSVECISNPNPRARTILIGGYQDDVYHSYRVSFKNTKEMMLFKLKHFDYFSPLADYERYYPNVNEELWNIMTCFSTRVKYTQGPLL